MWNPLSWVMEAAALMAIVLANGGVSRECNNIVLQYIICSFVFSFSILFFGLYFHFLVPYFEIHFQGEGPDWQDFIGIICLLVINSTISFIEENNAGNAAAALMARLAPKTRVCFFVDDIHLWHAD